MKIELFISLRYLLARRKEKFISLISAISVLGVAIGVMALIVVIAVMTGFDKDLRDKIVGNYSHITVTNYKGIDSNNYSDLTRALKSIPQIKGFSPYVNGQVLVKEQDKFFGLGLKGIEPSSEKQVTRIDEYIFRGSLADLDSGSVIIGKELATYLGLRLNSSLLVYSPLGKQHNLKVAAIFKSGMYDYDLNLIFTDLKTAQEIMGLPDRFSAIAVKLENLYLADRVRDELKDLMGFNYNFKTWMEANQNFFAALKLEKLTMFIILTLVILVASLNIISTLVVMVVEKTKDIGILKAIGMSSAQVRKIFTYQGILIGTLGVFLGTLGGIAVCGLLKKYQFIKLPRDIYYIDRLPVSLAWSDIAFVIAAALAITLISTIYPAIKAAGLKPVEALRYE